MSAALPPKTGLPLRAAAALGALWWVLARDGPGMFAMGAAAVVAALLVARRVGAPRAAAVRWRRVPRFFALFVWESVRGGLDVARRAVSRDMRLQPGFVVVRLTLAEEDARVLTALVVSLLPGTLAARLEGEALRVHALDLGLPIEADVRRLEREVAALFDDAPAGDRAVSGKR